MAYADDICDTYGNDVILEESFATTLKRVCPEKIHIVKQAGYNSYFWVIKNRYIIGEINRWLDNNTEIISYTVEDIPILKELKLRLRQEKISSELKVNNSKRRFYVSPIVIVSTIIAVVPSIIYILNCIDSSR